MKGQHDNIKLYQTVPARFGTKKGKGLPTKTKFVWCARRRNGLLESDVCEQLLMSYQELLAASTSQLACLYGAISGIAAFGLPVGFIKCVLLYVAVS